ncbi:hypothetical protein N7489_007991 [Penicillium chrysogenum]|uniref:uncharacterized protein n=1 Tax=Penicillium chrysogenum TaxID=5076 RepID=UPI0023A05EA2|nr:uncharacterized protein N7489_007991 [Penicillium chrysogenum]KAJ5237900.1 hypothetical protein N7489_007991 [Penicillium chrysogenum]KAJ5278203.1 hypothetical protein N7524_004356 [Penicillium chrysogenum]
MDEKPPFPIPERISSLMPLARQEALTTHQRRSVSTASKLSQISQTSVESTASDFLATKVAQLEDESHYIAEIKAGLDEANASMALENTEYRRQIEPLMNRLRSTTSTLRAMTPPDEGLLERAYRDTIVTRVMRADGKQQALDFNQKKFKDQVNKYYNVSTVPNKTYCHVLGLYVNKKDVKAAHIVPKSMDREELGHLFGDQDAVVTLPQNGLSLHHKVESLLDKGDIAIVPMPGKIADRTEWRCVVLNESIDKDIVYQPDFQPGAQPETIRVKDLDLRPLKFLSDNRPRRRYLYMRFLISYLWAKRRNLPDIATKVEAKRFWPSEGAYLQRSTLQTLARCISGCEIPHHLISKQTFQNSSTPARDVQAGMILAADIADAQRVHCAGPDLMGALTKSMKRL